MTRPPRTHLVMYAARAALGALTALGLFATVVPAQADYYRSCGASLRFAPQNPSQTYLSYDFSVGRTVRHFSDVGLARRTARQRMISCVEAHWAAGESTTLPDDCIGMRGYRIDGYPFRTSMRSAVTEALCAANPGTERLVISVDLTITGNRDGCVTHGSSDTINIARNAPITCAREGDEAGGGAPASETGTVAEIVPGIFGTLALYGEAREGWNLPGQDYAFHPLEPGVNAVACATECARDSRCHAWTYKYQIGAEPPLCFLKDGVPGWRQDERFVSGIKGVVAPTEESGAEPEPAPPAEESEAPAEPAPPASAHYQILPFIRLPGHDLYMLGGADGISDWMDCRQACTEDSRCGAWTYRAPRNRCLIKARPGLPIPDTCCRSGIKQ